ncbi:MAG: hypothetical protein JXR51_03630 [Bacteroidales bacterium]|nr:hypothetical protein [Bacteroidales bacterium]MBN2756244.1 hypothetical protein [Bacteroidales bacterium]
MFSDFPTWWDGLSVLSKVYWIIAFPATLIFLIQLIMTFIGGDVDHDMDGDMDNDLDHDIGFHLITFKNMIAFFTLFAWSGLASIEGGLSVIFTIVISTVSGVIMMIIMAGLFYYISKFTQSGTMDMNNAIGQTGDVYLSIPSKKTGLGKVQVNVQGQLRTLDAMTEDTEDIKTNSIIEVVEIISGNVLLVKRVR